MDYVLVGDTHTFRTGEQSQLAARRILYDPADAFNAAFHPVRTWTLPNGEVLTLYARTFAPTEPGIATEDTLALLTLFGDRLGAGDAVVLVSPDQIYGLGMALPADAGATVVALPPAGESPAAALPLLEQLVQTHRRVFLASHNANQVDPEGVIAGWLRDHALAGNDLWANSIQVTPFAVIGAGEPTMQVVDGQWRDGAKLSQLVTFAAPGVEGLTAGGASAFALDWAKVGEAPRKGSLQLLAPDGALVAQEDHDLVAGRQAYVLLIPRSAPAGDYRLVLAIYDPNTLDRTLTVDGADHLELGVVSFGPAPAASDPDAILPQLRHPEDSEREGS
ncbi:MAG: hypothetical protein IPK16_22705 [Anaerolineales bacterium]|nr:hypothetical protein [Anaerolineales bacterium]